MIQKNVLIINKLGLHARAAAKLVSTASAFSS
ncbi:MAG: HPr family phosphocarrier protein, partial [Pseudomonadota bacterium]|nr:HPr family phosphocarrier protein [Pseudomonadota bacterium]